MKCLRVFLAVCCLLTAVHAQRRKTMGPNGRPLTRPGLAMPGSAMFPGPEFLVDTSVSRVPAPGDQAAPSVAYGGGAYLAVWRDQRLGPGIDDVFACRIDTAGNVLDPVGIPVATGPESQSSRAVAFDGTNFLAAWKGPGIRAARIDQSGVVLDSGGFTIYDGPGFVDWPSVAFGGSCYLVVWQLAGGVDRIYGARVTPDGTVLDPGGFAIGPESLRQGNGNVAFDGTNFLVAWHHSDSLEVYGTRVSQNGVVLDPGGFRVCNRASDKRTPRTAFGNGYYLVAWKDGSDIYGARVTPAGTRLDPQGIRISDANASPSVGYDGGNYLVTWGSGSQVRGARVTRSGQVLDTAGFRISPVGAAGDFPDLAFGGGRYLVAWTAGSSERDIVGARVTPGGSVLDSSGILVSTASNSQTYPAAGWNGSDYLVVWQNETVDGAEIRGARVNTPGQTLPPGAFRISPAKTSAFMPSAASFGTDWLVGWSSEDSGSDADVVVARIGLDGTVLDTGGITVCSAPGSQDYVQVATDGTRYLVVWRDERADEGDVYCARVEANGTVLDPDGNRVVAEQLLQCVVDVAFDGTNYLVVWADLRNGDYPNFDVYGARITPDAVVIDTGGIPIAVNPNKLEGAPCVDFDGENYIVFWNDYDFAHYAQVCGKRVSRNGVVLDTAVVLFPGNGDQWGPRTAFDGNEFGVVWYDERAGETTHLYGARVKTDLSVKDTLSVVLQPGNQAEAALVRGAGQALLLTYQGWAGAVDGSFYGNTRVWGKFDPFLSGVMEQNPMPWASRRRLAATVVRGLPPGAVVFDAMGRRVVNPRSGIYFVRGEERGGVGRTRKVVIQR